MTNLYAVLVFLFASSTMLSGLTAAPFGGALLTTIMLANYKKIDFTKILERKFELAFLCWIFISCLWSASGAAAFTKFLALIFFYIATIITTNPSFYNLDKYKKFAMPLVFGCLLAIVFFVVESTTDGYISKEFRAIFQPHYRHHFLLHFLDRGCSVLSMLSWIVIFILFKRKRWFFAIAYTFLVVYILKMSDSLASYLAFVLGIATFVAVYFSRMYFVYIVMLVVFACGVAMPIFSHYQMPREISDSHPSIPASGKHRLFIWKFTAEKAIEKAAFGWGFNSSPNIPVDEETDTIYLEHYKWPPLPLHSHNNYMQMWLECGIVGLGFFIIFLIRMLNKILYISRKDSSVLWGAASTACFINYWFIAMLSYGMWQMWWIGTISTIVLLFSILRNFDRDSKV